MNRQTFDVLHKQAEDQVDESRFKSKLGEFVCILNCENKGQFVHRILIICGLSKVSAICIKFDWYVKHINAKETIRNYENNTNDIVCADVNGNCTDGGYTNEKKLSLIPSNPFNNVSTAKTDIIGFLDHVNRKSILVCDTCPLF